MSKILGLTGISLKIINGNLEFGKKITHAVKTIINKSTINEILFE